MKISISTGINMLVCIGICAIVALILFGPACIPSQTPARPARFVEVSTDYVDSEYVTVIKDTKYDQEYILLHHYIIPLVKPVGETP